jgi:hypothetical protein
MAPKIITAIWGLYAVVILSGCSIAMALHGNKEPNFDHVKVGVTKEEIDFEFNGPGTSRDLGDGNIEVTYKYEIGNSPNAGRAGVNGYIDLATIGLAEPILTLIELFRERMWKLESCTGLTARLWKSLVTHLRPFLPRW